jgi:hypothetical protein
VIYVVELLTYNENWLPHSWHRSLAEMLMTQQTLEYRSGLPCRLRAVSVYNGPPCD